MSQDQTSKASSSTDYSVRIKRRQEENLQRRIQADPCYTEREISSNCLVDSGWDYQLCKREVENVNLCTTFWSNVEKERRDKGILPYRPPAAERETIKREFLSRINSQIKEYRSSHSPSSSQDNSP